MKELCCCCLLLANQLWTEMAIKPILKLSPLALVVVAGWLPQAEPWLGRRLSTFIIMIHNHLIANWPRGDCNLLVVAQMRLTGQKTTDWAGCLHNLISTLINHLQMSAITSVSRFTAAASAATNVAQRTITLFVCALQIALIEWPARNKSQKETRLINCRGCQKIPDTIKWVALTRPSDVINKLPTIGLLPLILLLLLPTNYMSTATRQHPIVCITRVHKSARLSWPGKCKSSGNLFRGANLINSQLVPLTGSSASHGCPWSGPGGWVRQNGPTRVEITWISSTTRDVGGHWTREKRGKGMSCPV